MKGTARTDLASMPVIRLIDFVLGCFAIVVYVSTFIASYNPIMAGITIIVESIYIMIRVRHNYAVLMCSLILVYAVYSIVAANYVIRIDSIFVTMADSIYAYEALRSLLLFISIIVFMLPSKVNRFNYGGFSVKSRKSYPITVACICILLVFICVYGFSRPDNIGESRGEPSALYEYAVIFIILGIYLSGSNRTCTTAVLLIACAFAAQNLIYGGRVTAMQILTAVFIMVMAKRCRGVIFIAALVVGALGFSVIGSLRTGWVDASAAEVVSDVSNLVTQGGAWDTAYSSWYTSISFYIYGEGLSDGARLNLFGRWVASMFLGGSAVEGSNLAVLTRSVVMHYYGGVLPAFFDFYLGTGGVVLIGAYVGFLLRRVASLTNGDQEQWVCEGAGGVGRGVKTLLLVYFATTTPRWFLYSPSPLFRGLGLAAIVFACGIAFAKLLAARQSKHGKHGVREAL